MNIVMLTNTYTPFVGGVPRSVKTFTEAYRKKGHEVIVVAPEFEDVPGDEEGVVRLPAIKNVSDAGFSVRLPIPGYLSNRIEEFEPDLAHAHHPFLLGDTALRLARQENIPLVFTNHTLYEQYTHYLPVDNSTVRQYVRNLVKGYANLCDEVFAPSQSVARMLKDRGVETPIDVVPTGIDVDEFGGGDGRRFRNRTGIDEDVFLVGHLGRLAEEKNIPFLIRAVAGFLRDHEDTEFLLVGEGPIEDQLTETVRDQGLEDRVHFAGELRNQDLYDAYASMDLFAFGSKTETQGMVLVEAMSSGTPVVALDASGTRDVVVNGETGRLIRDEDEETFADAIEWYYDLSASKKEIIQDNTRKRAEGFDKDVMAERALEIYSDLVADFQKKTRDPNLWQQAKSRLETEWQILQNFASATDAVVVEGE
ncbi:MAG: glycosyltransferase [bacterium]